MMSDYIAKDVMCPFFKDIHSSKQSIYCEGINDSSVIKIKFIFKKQFDSHVKIKCCNDYKHCMIACMQYKKYNQSEE